MEDHGFVPTSSPRCALAACLRELEGRFKRCGGCRLVHYCSAEHQAEDWPTHRDFCKAEQARLEAAAAAGGVVVREASAAELERERVGALSARELRTELKERGVDARGLAEKDDLADALLRSPAPVRRTAAVAAAAAAATAAAATAAVSADAAAASAQAPTAFDGFIVGSAGPPANILAEDTAANAWSDAPLETNRAAADEGDAAAQHAMGHRYARGGQGVPENLALASAWYRRAAERDFASAQFVLGTTLQNDRDAVAWLEVAAEHGEPCAEFCLALCLERGRGVAADIEQAVRLYTRAAARGLKEAVNALRRLGRLPAGPPPPAMRPGFGRCSWCNISPAKLLACAVCFSAGYCGKDCQRADWPRHKGEGKGLHGG